MFFIVFLFRQLEVRVGTEVKKVHEIIPIRKLNLGFENDYIEIKGNCFLLEKFNQFSRLTLLFNKAVLHCLLGTVIELLH